MPRRHFHQLRDAATDGSGQGQGSGGAASSTPPVLDAPPAHNAERARVDGAADERARISEIDAMCRQHGIADNVRNDMIQRGTTIEAARGIKGGQHEHGFPESPCFSAGSSQGCSAVCPRRQQLQDAAGC